MTAPSPSLCLSPSWRGPSGKSSSPRLSKKKKRREKETLHRLTAQPRISSANIAWLFSRPLETSATTCHPPLRASVASPQHLSALSFFSSCLVGRDHWHIVSYIKLLLLSGPHQSQDIYIFIVTISLHFPKEETSVSNKASTTLKSGWSRNREIRLVK